MALGLDACACGAWEFDDVIIVVVPLFIAVVVFDGNDAVVNVTFIDVVVPLWNVVVCDVVARIFWI